MRPWQTAAFSDVAAPGFFTVTPEQFEKFIAFVSGRLGSLKAVTAIQNAHYNVFASSHGFQVRTVHVMSAEFEKGPATVRWLLLRQNGRWMVEGMQVNSDLLVQ